MLKTHRILIILLLSMIQRLLTSIESGNTIFPMTSPWYLESGSIYIVLPGKRCISQFVLLGCIVVF